MGIRPSTILFLVFSLLVALVAGSVVTRALRSDPPQEIVEDVPPTTKPAGPSRWPIPVAAVDLPSGRTIAPDDLKQENLTVADMQQRDFPTTLMNNPMGIIGRTLKEPITQGKPFVIDDFFQSGTGPVMSYRLQPGERAISIPCNSDSLVTGFISPESYVDVIFRPSESSQPDGPTYTVTLVQNVRVLAVGVKTIEGAQPDEETETVTLAVAPDDAQKLTMAAAEGT